ncbi:MAG TPA: putative quinol monooxygenase [Baekduia sp.]|jgi:quinol monooxygenase YgiN
MAARAGLPPGTQLHAQCVRDGADHQVRLLGDEARGYLLTGTLPDLHNLLDEIWFAELADALAAATRLGIPRDAWAAVTAVQDVRTFPERKATTMSAIDVIALFTAKEGSEDALGALLSTLVEPSRAEAANVSYTLHRVADAAPARFVVVERWASAEGFAEHRVAPHMAAFREPVAPLLGAPADVLVLEPAAAAA